VVAVTLSCPPDLPEHLVALGVALPLVLGRDVEQLALGGTVTLPDDQLKTSAGEVVQGRVVLVGAHRVQQAERGDGREQADAPRQRGDMAEDDGWRGGDERPLVALPHPEPVEAQLLCEQGVVENLAEAFTGRLPHAGHGVRGVHDQRDGEEFHDATRSLGASLRTS
jgi:hypothetical protein